MAIIQCPKCGTQLEESLKFCPKCGCALSAQQGEDGDRTILLSGQRQGMPKAQEDEDKTVLLYGNQGGNVSAPGNAGQNTPPLKQAGAQARPNPQAGQPASRQAKAEKSAPKKAKKESGGKKGTGLIVVICVEAVMLLGIAAVIVLQFLGIL